MATTFLRRFGRRLGVTYRHFTDDGGPMMAAAMAYYLALSFFPLLLVLLAGLGIVLKSTAAGHDAEQRMLAAIEQQASPALAEQIGRALEVVSQRAPTGGPIGFLVLLATAIALFTQIDAAFDRIWEVPLGRRRGWWQWLRRLFFRRLKALAMLIGVGAFVLAVMIASVVWSAVQSAMEPAVRFGATVRWGLGLSINVVLNFFAFAVVFRFVPKVRIRWAEAIRGGVVAAILWEVGRQLLAVYLIRQGYPSAYGIIGSFLAIMLWSYYAMIVLFFGAEYTRVVREDGLGRW